MMMTMNNTKKKDYCVRKAFIDIQRASAAYESQNRQQQKELEYENLLDF
jgi:hypothetical protein